MPAVYCWDAQTDEYDNDDDDEEEGGDNSRITQSWNLKTPSSIIHIHTHIHIHIVVEI